MEFADSFEANLRLYRSIIEMQGNSRVSREFQKLCGPAIRVEAGERSET